VDDFLALFRLDRALIDQLRIPGLHNSQRDAERMAAMVTPLERKVGLKLLLPFSITKTFPE